MLYTTYYVKARMTGNLKSLANLPVNPSTRQLVHEFRQRAIVDTRLLTAATCPHQSSDTTSSRQQGHNDLQS